MSDFDLDRLGDVWRQQPDAAEMERLQKSASAVARRARRAQVVDIGAALIVSAVVIFLVVSHPKLGTFLMGAAAILILLAGNIRLRRLRQVELRNLTGSTEEMLDQSITRVETTVRHHRFGAIGIGPAFVIGTLLAYAAQSQSIFFTLQNWSTFRLFWVAAGVSLVAAGMVYSWRSMQRGKRELERLRIMREAYRHEHDSTTS
jgi:hypothetical protein